MTAKEWRRAEAMRRIRIALAHVQRAQNELGDACAQLSTLRWGDPTNRRVGKVYDRVHAEWYRVERLLRHPRVEVDCDPTPDELSKVEARRCCS